MANTRAAAGNAEEREDEARHEFRAGAVFYGGVSLAVYENGVARAFHDAATRAGLFAPLLDLIDTRFVVDVISGSSAGGINGLLLAAALERGYPFQNTAKLWRLHGGIEDLLRPARDEGAPSLLRGETYYLTQLRRAFRDICMHEPDPAYRPPQEIDVFVTGTDLAGADSSFEDAFGEAVPTRTHRLVFHMQHRQERKALGYVRQGQALDSRRSTPETPLDRALQADILASVARITSSFPGAFPPFNVREFDRNPPERPSLEHTPELVRHALGRLCGREIQADSQLIDGGVLDNRPFGPLLEAVFHRMPFQHTRGVTRRVFYVDPDPDVLQRKADAKRAQRPDEPRYSPLAVAVNSVVALPSYDSITADVDSVSAHNARMLHLRSIRKRLAALPGQGADAPVYRYALEREVMGLLSGSELPGPLDPDGAEQQELAALAADTRALRAIDINYHLRRAVSLFYGYSSAHDRPAVDPRANQELAYQVGRVVKALKLLRDVWTSELRRAQERNEGQRRSPTARGAHGAAQPLPPIAWRLRLLRHYLGGAWISSALGWDLGSHVLSSDDLSSENLSVLAIAARKELQRFLGAPAASIPAAPAATPGGAGPAAQSSPAAGGLLGLLDAHLEGLLGGRAALADFESKDCSLYPLELASGTHELDEVKIIRISPDDPKLPAALHGKGHFKLTGDELAHFSAFLRRDFRTNDLAWGHVDALERIVRALLTEDARQRAVPHLDALAAAFSREALGERLGVERRPELRPVAERLAAAFAALRAGCSSESWEAFTNAFITAAQTAAAHEYIALIVQDARAQDQRFNATEPRALELQPGDALSQLVALELGEAPVLQALPPSVVVEYASRAAILLWGMVELSWRGAKPLARARPLVVGTLAIIHTLASLIRTERRAAAYLLFGTFAASVALMISVAFDASPKLLGFGVIGVAFCVLGAGLLGTLQRLRALGIAATLLIAVAAVALLGTTSLCVRLPGGRLYPLNAEEEFCPAEKQRAGQLAREPVSMGRP